MRKIIFHLETGYAGMKSTENGLYPDDVTDYELDDDAWYRACNNAEAYGIYPISVLEDMSDEEAAEENEDNYSNSIAGWWEDYDPEEHDGLVAGGGKWDWAP